MAGKIFIPSTINPLNPPPSGHYLLWIDDQGFFKKMDSSGSISNLSAQSLNDLNDTNLSTLEDGHILVYDQNTDKWVNQDFHEIGMTLKISSLYDENGDVRIEATSTGVDVKNNYIKNLKLPDSGSDAASKDYVDTVVANSGSGDPTRLYNDAGATVVHGTTEGVQLKDKNEVVRQSVNTSGSTFTGQSTFKQSISNNLIEYVCTTDDITYLQVVDFGDKLKWRQKHGKPLIFQAYSDDDSSVKSIFEMGYNSEYQAKFYQKTHFESGVFLTTPNDTPWLIGGDLGGRKTLYVKTDQFQGNRFTANYGKGFTFSIDESVDNVDDDNTTIFSLSSTYVMSHKKHRMFNGIDMSYKRIEFVGTPDQPNDAANKAYVDDSVSSALAVVENDIDSITGDGALEFDVDDLKFKLNLLEDEEAINYSLNISGANNSAFDGDYASPEWEGVPVPFDLDLLGSSIKFKPNQGNALMYVNGDKVIGYCDEISHWIFAKLTSTFDFSNPSMGDTSIPVDFWAQLGTGTTTLASGKIIPLNASVTFTGTPRDGSYITNTPAGFGVKAVKQLSQAEEGVLLDSKVIKQELDKKVEEDNIYDFVRLQSSNGSVWKLSVNDSGGVVVSPD